MPAFRLEVLVQPRSSRNAVTGWQGGALKLKVTAPPVEGAANAAVVEFLAEVLGIPRRAVRIVRGETARSKLVEIEAPEAICRLRLEQVARGFVDKKRPRG